MSCIAVLQFIIIREYETNEEKSVVSDSHMQGCICQILIGFESLDYLRGTL